MNLASLDDLDIFELLKEDSEKIMGYKISRTEDKKMILEIKFDVSDSMLELATFTRETSQEQKPQSDR